VSTFWKIHEQFAEAQSAVPWERRGAVTALQQFVRSIGGAVGVSLMGLIVAAHVKQLADSSPGLVTSSVRPVFTVVFGVIVAMLVVGLFILLRSQDLPDAERPEATGQVRLGGGVWGRSAPGEDRRAHRP
jgi:hypothetical protein